MAPVATSSVRSSPRPRGCVEHRPIFASREADTRHGPYVPCAPGEGDAGARLARVDARGRRRQEEKSFISPSRVLLLAVVQARRPTSAHSLIVGHNPGLGSLRQRTLGIGRCARTCRNGNEFPDDGPGRDRLRPNRGPRCLGIGRLERLVTPALLGGEEDDRGLRRIPITAIGDQCLWIGRQAAGG